MAELVAEQAALPHAPRAWQRFYKGFKERFRDDCALPLPDGRQLRLAQAPSAGGGGGGGDGGGGGGGGGGQGPLLRAADPSLTGTTVWDGCVALAQYLLARPSALPARRGGGGGLPVVLELGAGTGGVSLALLAARRACAAVITDLPAMLPHLRLNVQRNAALLDRPCAAVVLPLRWGEDADVAAAAAEAAAAAAAAAAAGGAAGAASGAGVNAGTARRAAAAAAAAQPPAQRSAQADPPPPPTTPAPAPPAFDVIVGADLVYYSYTRRTPHSRLLLRALAAAAAPRATAVFLALSLHHNPGEVAAFLDWARRDWGFEVARCDDVPDELRVPDVLLVRLTLVDAHKAAAASAAAAAGTLRRGDEAAEDWEVEEGEEVG